MSKKARKSTDQPCETRQTDAKKSSALPFRFGDLIIVIFVAAISLLPLLLFPHKDANTVVICWHGEEIYRESIDKDAVITTPDGANTIQILNGKVYMLEADCRDKLCVHAGSALPSKPVVCLPNRVIVSVISDEKADSVSW